MAQPSAPPGFQFSGQTQYPAPGGGFNTYYQFTDANGQVINYGEDAQGNSTGWSEPQGPNTSAQQGGFGSFQGLTGADPSLAVPGQQAQQTTEQTMASNLTPDYLSQLFPNGIPTSSPSTVSDVPSVVQNMGSQLDPTQFSKTVLSGLNPEFNREQQTLNEGLASAGIVGGSTAGADAQLGLQQGAQAQSALVAPILQLLGYNVNAQTSDQSAALNAGEFNSSQENAGQQFDISNLIKSAMFDAGQGTAAGQTAAQMTNQDWLALLGANTGVIQSGLGTNTGSFTPVFTQPAASGGGFASLGAGLAPAPTINTNFTGTPAATPGQGTEGGVPAPTEFGVPQQNTSQFGIPTGPT
jgi:hypothetical protein